MAFALQLTDLLGMQSIQPKFPAGISTIPWMNGVVFSNNLLINGDIISDNNTWNILNRIQLQSFYNAFFWPVEPFQTSLHFSKNTLIINTNLCL